MSSSEEDLPRKGKRDIATDLRKVAHEAQDAKAKLEEASAAAAAVPAIEKRTAFERLKVTVHRAAALPAMDSDGLSDPYAVVRIGKGKGQETKCLRNTLNPVFEDSFEFPLTMQARKHESLTVDLYDRDWVLGIPLKPDYMGRIEIALDSVPGGGIVQQWLPLRNSDGSLYKEARVQLSLSIFAMDEIEAEDSFWNLFGEPVKEERGGVVGRVMDRIKGERSGKVSEPMALERIAAAAQTGPAAGPGAAAGGEVALADEDLQQLQALRQLFPLMRPVIANLFRLMYVIVRPVMLFLLWHRKILMDWEKPGMATLFSLLFFWSWYHEVVTALLLAYLFGWAFLQVLNRSTSPAATADAAIPGVAPAPGGPERLNMAQMMEAYKKTKAELFYSELDPLQRDLESAAAWTKHICDNVELYRDNLLFYGDRQVVGWTLGVLGLGCVLCFVFSHSIGGLAYTAIRYALLLLYVRCVILQPISTRWPEFFPVILTFVLRPFRTPLRAMSLWVRKRSQLRELTRAEEWEDATRAMRSKIHMTVSDWEMLGHQVGRKLRVRKGQVVEDPGTLGHAVYRLAKGKVELRGPQSGAAALLLNAPCQLFTANVLHGHGVITHIVTATVNCKVLAFDVADMRRIFDTQPKIAEKFFLDLALELALELKFLIDKMRRDAKATHPNNADPPVMAPVLAAAAGTSATGVAESVLALSEAPVLGAVEAVAGNSIDRPPTPIGEHLVPLAVAPVRIAPVPVPQPAPAVHAASPLQQSMAPGALFSMSQQALPTVDDSSDKLWRFFQETFHVAVKREALKVFDKTVWTKKGWTRFPGRLFVTPQHLAFWSQWGKKTMLGAAARGAATESWIIPLAAMTSFSLHERELHLKFTYDPSNAELASLEQHSVVVEAAPVTPHRKAAKPATIKVYSDDIQQLIELRRTVEISLARRETTTGIDGFAAARASGKDAAGGGGGGGEGGSTMCAALALDTPNLGGVELTAGTVRPEDLVVANESNPFAFLLEATKKGVKGGLHVLQHGAHWLGGPKAGSGGNDNNVPVDSPSSARDILNLRASVLDSDDRVRLVGETQEESDKSLLLFAPNEIAFKRGVHYERALYQVVQGVCAAEDESGVVVARFKQGEMFGELAFLLHMQNHLNIRALTKLELRQFTAASLEDKFEKYPGLGARFYEFLCYHEISFMNSQLVIDSRRRASAVEASGAAATHPKE